VCHKTTKSENHTENNRSIKISLAKPCAKNITHTQHCLCGIHTAPHHTLYSQPLDFTLTEVFSFSDRLIASSRTFLSHSQKSLSLCCFIDGRNFSYVRKVLSRTYHIDKILFMRRISLENIFSNAILYCTRSSFPATYCNKVIFLAICCNFRSFLLM
jgi:hypothetical protein